jgi:hypothetical protein
MESEEQSQQESRWQSGEEPEADEGEEAGKHEAGDRVDTVSRRYGE